ncbi:cell division protein ZipA [Legionella israelensis]|uniref:Cell division protein ZipA n=1 Tax=Legionella israelensis TaxID=454 RepID=A0A0W0WQB7_9GAMM|nr:cell division protein ZipA [Legionella israelensis]KTD34529.1 cell division protein [Legionella israelensis]QBS09238.1 cell division protein ZipA [Legionella israelensis]SCX98476.1 cell division protein ZipA [Legionella israelensis DSM 19235]STX58984.1 cell division protein [Legionella israelensis]
MQANWSLMINLLLLIGVIVAIIRVMKSRHQRLKFNDYPPSPGVVESRVQDDIISVRKIESKHIDDLEKQFQKERDSKPKLSIQQRSAELMNKKDEANPLSQSVSSAAQMRENTSVVAKKEHDSRNSLMLFLLAKNNRQFAGYELLQTLLTAGLRYGEGQLFHRHQSPNGQGTVFCSLAAATESGTFDMQNIGAFSVRGLCLFMQTSNNPSIDEERFSIMLETAQQLREELDCYLLDEQRKPLTEEGIAGYYRRLNLSEE